MEVPASTIVRFKDFGPIPQDVEAKFTQVALDVLRGTSTLTTITAYDTPQNVDYVIMYIAIDPAKVPEEGKSILERKNLVSSQPGKILAAMWKGDQGTVVRMAILSPAAALAFAAEPWVLGLHLTDQCVRPNGLLQEDTSNLRLGLDRDGMNTYPAFEGIPARPNVLFAKYAQPIAKTPEA